MLYKMEINLRSLRWDEIPAALADIAGKISERELDGKKADKQYEYEFNIDILPKMDYLQTLCNLVCDEGLAVLSDDELKYLINNYLSICERAIENHTKEKVSNRYEIPAKNTACDVGSLSATCGFDEFLKIIESTKIMDNVSADDYPVNIMMRNLKRKFYNDYICFMQKSYSLYFSVAEVC